MYKFVLLLLCLFLGHAVAKTPDLNKHGPFDVNCESCHADKPDSAPLSNVCLSCHGDYEEVAALTAKHEYNPHNLHSPYDQELSCTDCHAMHKKSYNLCEVCHDVEYSVP